MTLNKYVPPADVIHKTIPTGVNHKMRIMKTWSFILICVSQLWWVCLANGATSELPATDYRYVVAKQVFDNLVEAKGVRNMPVPSFRLVRSERNVAWTKLETAEIGLEEKAYDICTSFGKDSLHALAAILGHELTHYYEKHGWTALFVNDHPNLESASAPADLEAHRQDEWQADYLGGFLAFAAGYNTFGIMPDFLEKVYEQYGFDVIMPGYPSLEERQRTAEESLEKCRKLVDVYQMANCLVAMGKFEMAKSHYEFILKDFQSREIYNNLGVNSLSAALAIGKVEGVDFAYPFELDAESRLMAVRRGGQGDFASQKQHKYNLLEEAIGFFKTAILLDESYAPGYLNLACAYALLGEGEDARYYVNKALKYTKNGGYAAVVADANVLLGILAANEENVPEADLFFDKAIALGSSMAMYNKNLLSGLGEKITRTPAVTGTHRERQKINGISMEKLVAQLQRGQLIPTYQIDLDRETVFAVLQMPASRVLIHLKPLKDEFLLLQLTNEAFRIPWTETSDEGAGETAILEHYQQPSRRVRMTTGKMLVYQPDQLLFILDGDGTVKEWGVFKDSN